MSELHKFLFDGLPVVEQTGLAFASKVKGTSLAGGFQSPLLSGGSFLIQLSSVGSKALQCGHSYQKNSTTSILPEMIDPPPMKNWRACENVVPRPTSLSIQI